MSYDYHQYQPLTKKGNNDIARPTSTRIFPGC